MTRCPGNHSDLSGSVLGVIGERGPKNTNQRVFETSSCFRFRFLNRTNSAPAAGLTPSAGPLPSRPALRLLGPRGSLSKTLAELLRYDNYPTC